jgi:hypothetical protein
MTDLVFEEIVNRPWHAVQARLREKYSIVGELDLVEIDRDPLKMYHVLRAWYRPEYQPHEKILIYHYDTDFYSKGGYGHTLYNFLLSLRSLDISPSVIVFLTNHHGISQEIQKFYHEFYHDFDYDLDHMTVFESDYVLPHAPQDPLKHTPIAIDEIKKHFVCLNGRLRSHRMALLAALKSREILAQGICSWHFQTIMPQAPALQLHEPDQSEPCTARFLTTVPHARANDLIAWDRFFVDCVQQHHGFFDQDFQHPRILGGCNSQRYYQPAIKQALLYVSTETVFDYPYPYLSEKSYKPIMQKRPFVIAGAPGSLAVLKAQGFRTFSDHWDESYDQVTDSNQRLRAILGIIEHICSLSIDQLKELCYSMQDVLDHNFQHYVDVFAGSNLEKKLETL